MACLHDMKDKDSHYIINPEENMAISNANSVKNSLNLGDHDSEIFTFEVPKEIDGHDMSFCNVVRVHYINTSTDKMEVSKDAYKVKDMHVAEDDAEKLLFTWKISGNATKYAGNLAFRIEFTCEDENNVVTYRKWTNVFKDVYINDGFDNAEAILEEFSDILEAWKQEIEDNAGGVVSDEQLGRAFKNYIEQNVNLANARIRDVVLLADKWAGNSPLFSQVVTIDSVTENSQVDLTPSVEQLAVFYEKDLAFVTENDGGVVTVYAIGQKPTNDYTIQATITEVIR